MDSSHSARTSLDTAPLTGGSTPASLSLRELLRWVLLPAADQAHVDALLEGLASPLGPYELDRTRVDFLLEVLECEHLAGMQGSNGQDLHAAALGALLKLGEAFATELSPQALARARGTRSVTKRNLPLTGLFLVLAGSLGLAVALNKWWALWVLIPSLPTLLGGGFRVRGLQTAGVVFMGAVSTGLLGIAAYTYSPRNTSFMLSGLGNAFAMLFAAIGLLLALGAFLLRRPWWHLEDEPIPLASIPRP